MSDDASTESLRAAERELQRAQLASDVAALDTLVDDALLFTGADGSLLSKHDDLEAHRSGRQVLRRVEELDLRVRVVGSTGATWVLAGLEGSVDGEPFAARVRYTRTWTHDVSGWTMIAAQATVAAG